MNKASSTESGNILFLILIAVVLFAALTFAVTMSSRSGENVDTDKVRIAASQITQSGADAESGILRLRVSRNIDNNAISFETDRLTAYANPGCADATAPCRLFSPSGGQISYSFPNPEWLNRSFNSQTAFGDWLYSGTACVPGIGSGSDSTCAGNAETLELIAFLPWLNRDICVEINKKLGVTSGTEAPPQITGSGWGTPPEFIGTFGNGVAIIDGANRLFGHPEGCFEATSPASSYHYYRVLLAQ